MVKDKSANVLKVFAPHILPNTDMCVDSGTENEYFRSLTSIVKLHDIPGPIHVDRNSPNYHTQTVESSHSGIKMRLRLGRGLHRHNLQAVLDFEDFIYNRTNGDPADIFKKLGDTSKLYLDTVDNVTVRKSVVAIHLPEDDVQGNVGLHINQIQQLCKTSTIFDKSSRYQVKYSKIIKTQLSALRNCITVQVKAARIHEQSIMWGIPNIHFQEPQVFDLSTINVFCSCTYFKKETVISGWCCTHIVGQLRRVLYLTDLAL